MLNADFCFARSGLYRRDRFILRSPNAYLGHSYGILFASPLPAASRPLLISPCNAHIIMNRQQQGQNMSVAVVTVAALFLATSSAFSLTAPPGFAGRRKASSRCAAIRTSSPTMVASLPKPTDSSRAVGTQVGSNPANQRLHVQVCVCVFVLFGRNRLVRNSILC